MPSSHDKSFFLIKITPLKQLRWCGLTEKGGGGITIYLNLV